VRGEEALAKLQKGATSGNHHLVDIVWGIRENRANLGLEVKDNLEE
jgi:hypothetical protein